MILRFTVFYGSFRYLGFGRKSKKNIIPFICFSFSKSECISFHQKFFYSKLTRQYFIPVMCFSYKCTECNELFEISGLHDRIKQKLNEYISKRDAFDKVNIVVRSSYSNNNGNRKLNPQFLHSLAKFFTEESDIEALHFVRDNCAELFPEELAKNGNYMPCLARIMWLNGNIKSSVELFEKAYFTSSSELQDKIINLLENLIISTVKNKGEAQVKLVIKFTSEFYLKTNRISIMRALWCSLFNSEWFDVQCLSEELLKQFPQLKKSIEIIMPKIAHSLLLKNEVQSYQRLIETTLRNEMNDSSGILLRALFDYYYKQGYISGCAAVVYCCENLNIKLTNDQKYKYAVITKSVPKIEKYFVDDIKYKF